MASIMLGYRNRVCCVRPVDSIRAHRPVRMAPALMPSRAGAVLLVLLACAGGTAIAQPLIQPPPAVAVEPQDDPGFFEVRSAMAELRDGVYYLNAIIGYRLSTEAI